MKLLAENLQEYKDINTLNEEEKIDEGLIDFFKSARALVEKAQKNPKDEKAVNNALLASFGKQFGTYPKLKTAILAWPLDRKVKLVSIAAEKLKDKTVGVLTLRKNSEGKLEVLGGKVAGGASQETTGA
jgi:hypothetical protein